MQIAELCVGNQPAPRLDRFFYQREMGMTTGHSVFVLGGNTDKFV
jgi:hypothetical protein